LSQVDFTRSDLGRPILLLLNGFTILLIPVVLSDSIATLDGGSADLSNFNLPLGCLLPGPSSHGIAHAASIQRLVIKIIDLIRLQSLLAFQLRPDCSDLMPLHLECLELAIVYPFDVFKLALPLFDLLSL
jgi:hypothetical protein